MKRLIGGILFTLLLSGPAFSQNIKVTRPARGELFQPGKVITITWAGSGLSGHLGVALVKTDQSRRYLVSRRLSQGKRQMSYRIPNNTVAGTYYIAIGDSKTVAVSDCFVIRKTVQSNVTKSRVKARAGRVKPMPDLIIKSVEISDRTSPYNKIYSGDELHFLITVKNIGNKTCMNEFSVGLSTEGCNTDNWGWQRIQMDGLNKGATVLKIIEVKGNSHIPGWRNTRNVCIKVDVRKQVDESKEYNNAKTLTIPVVRN